MFKKFRMIKRIIWIISALAALGLLGTVAKNVFATEYYDPNDEMEWGEVEEDDEHRWIVFAPEDEEEEEPEEESSYDDDEGPRVITWEEMQADSLTDGTTQYAESCFSDIEDGEFIQYGFITVRSSLCEKALSEKAIITAKFKRITSREEGEYYEVDARPDDGFEGKISVPEGLYDLVCFDIKNVEDKDAYILKSDTDFINVEVGEDKPQTLIISVTENKVKIEADPTVAEDLAAMEQAKIEKTDKAYNVALFVTLGILAVAAIIIVIIIIRRRKADRLM